MEAQTTKQQKTFAAKLQTMDKRVLDKAAPVLYGFLMGFEAGIDTSKKPQRRKGGKPEPKTA